MITISFKPQLQVPLRKLFLEKLGEKGLTPRKKMFPEGNNIEYEISETLDGKENGRIAAVFNEITNKEEYGYGFSSDIPIGSTVFARAEKDLEMYGGNRSYILYWALPKKKVRKKKVKEIELGSLADSLF